MESTTAAPPAAEIGSPLAREAAAICLERKRDPAPGLRAALPASPRWAALRALGTSLWLDTGDIDGIRKIWSRELQALTTNNTLLNAEVQKGAYDGLVKESARRLRAAQPGIGAEELVEEIAFVLNAAHGLQLVESFDADVSVELHTHRSRDVEGSYRYGKRFHAIRPDRFIVKVPLTPEGVLAARRLVKDGIRVNFTLGFSARQNGLIARVACPGYVNVFLGRLNSFVADNKLGDGLGVGEKATLASQRHVREVNRQQGTRVKQIGASIRGGRQCADLAGLDVLTIPLKAAEEFLKLDLPASELRDRTADDPAVALAPGLDLRQEGLHVLWEVSPAAREAFEALVREDLDRMTGDGLRRSLAARGLRDLFPDFSAEERARIAADGKIPVHSRWKDKVRAGDAAWDAILTESALLSFTADQKKLDDRIRGLI